ncbi:MAG TPA: ABC transporter permease [Gemmatimonadaceae bacterium]
MSLRRQITRGLRSLVHRGAVDADIDDELRHYFDETVAAYATRGYTPDEARRAAQLEVGNMTAAHQQVRSHGWENVVETVLTDLRHGLRRLRANPGFTIVSVLTLALGIGATTAIFSAVSPILFEPLPYPGGNHIVMVWYAGDDGSRVMPTFGNYHELAARSKSFEAIAGYAPWQPTMLGTAQPERLTGQAVNADFFRVLGVAPAIGRGLSADDDRSSGAKTVMISDRLWRRRFGGDANVIGRAITLNENSYTIVGVLPRDFENVLAPDADVWTLLQLDPPVGFGGSEWGHWLHVVARLRPAVTAASAQRDLDLIARTPQQEFPRAPWAALKNGTIVSALRDDVAGPVKPALLAVMGAVILLLVSACVNVTNLLLGRGSQRRAEFAMRVALGASRGRLLQQLLTESVVLALVGGALGLAIAVGGVQALVALSPPGMPRVHAIGVHGSVFLFALAVSTFVGIAVGLTPAIQAARDDLRAGLQEGSRSAVRGNHVTRRVLVVAEVALALVLLVGAGLLLRSIGRLFSISPGFDSSHLVTMQVQVATPHRIPGDTGKARYFEEVVDAVQRTPGVATAGFTSELPLSGADSRNDEYCGQIDGAPSTAQSCAFRYSVTPAYFTAMKIPLVRGRLLHEGDKQSAASHKVVVSEAFAKRAFGKRDPLGQHIRYSGSDQRPWDEIVGVVGDVREAGLGAEKMNAFYSTLEQAQWVDNPLWLVVRARGDAAALTDAIKQAVWSVDKDQPISRIATMDARIAATEAQRHFALIVFEAFALTALALAAIGIYGVVSGSVAERIREIGVRAALGASPGDISGLIIRQGMTLAAVGAVIGVGGAMFASRALVTLLFGVSTLDAVTYGGVIALLLAIAGIACWLPATRAARVDPSITLRAH